VAIGGSKKKSFGGCNVERFSPDVSPETESAPKTLNAFLPFEEALKLHLAIGQCLGKLNGYNRSTTLGRRKALKLSVRIVGKRVVVWEGNLSKKV